MSRLLLGLLLLAGCDKAPPVAAPPASSDGRSTQAALALARDYYGLIEVRRFAEAAALTRNGDTPTLEDRFGRYPTLRAAAGPAGESEGAAGSIYITIPATIEAMDADGGKTTIKEIVTLRRVNDVPGSTEAQRRWHIESVDAAATNDRAP